MEAIKLLTKHNACSEAIDFVRDNKYTLKQAWVKCERADWLLWFMCATEMATRKKRIHIICDCAATSLKYVSKGEERPRLAIEATRKYADEPTEDNLKLLNAARAAAWAAAWDAARAAAGDAAGAAAWAAAGDAAWDAARAAAWDAAHKKMCRMIRRKIKWEVKWK